MPTGRLVAFTMVEYPWLQPEIVFQGDTLVIREHRGHRLGMLVKTDLLRRLAVARPDRAGGWIIPLGGDRHIIGGV